MALLVRRFNHFKRNNKVRKFGSSTHGVENWTLRRPLSSTQEEEEEEEEVEEEENIPR